MNPYKLLTMTGWLMFAFITAAASCESSHIVCGPGETQPCTCSNGNSGSQVCDSNGTSWGFCDCDSSNEDGGTIDAHNNDAGVTNDANTGTDRAQDDVSVAHGIEIDRCEPPNYINNCSLDFGMVYLGTSRVLGITVRNLGHTATSDQCRFFRR